MAGNGPLPVPGARRRNAPTIPTTTLPASGRIAAAPECPYDLGAEASAWWAWAWALPQACAWSDGDLYVIGRRAVLEDDLAALNLIDGLDLDDLLAGADVEATQRVEWALRTLKGSASGSLAVKKEMRELDTRLGLTPEALAKLRWKIIDDGGRDVTPEPTVKPKPAAPARRHLRAVDPKLAAAG